MMSKEYVLLPAYGRAYLTIDQTVREWKKGKDFKIYGGPYCSIRNEGEMKRDVDRIVFIVRNVKTDKIMRYNYWMNPLAGLTSYV